MLLVCPQLLPDDHQASNPLKQREYRWAYIWLRCCAQSQAYTARALHWYGRSEKLLGTLPAVNHSLELVFHTKGPQAIMLQAWLSAPCIVHRLNHHPWFMQTPSDRHVKHYQNCMTLQAVTYLNLLQLPALPHLVSPCYMHTSYPLTPCLSAPLLPAILSNQSCIVCLPKLGWMNLRRQ